MDSKDKLILSKLLSLATKQQKIITKLAQAQATGAEPDVEANKAYLQSAWQTAGMNSLPGTPIGTPTVTYTPGGMNGTVRIEGNYMLTGEIPADKREKFQATLNTQIKTQKPELDGKVSTVFKDPPLRRS